MEFSRDIPEFNGDFYGSTDTSPPPWTAFFLVELRWSDDLPIGPIVIWWLSIAFIMSLLTGREIHYGSSSKFPVIWNPDFLSSFEIGMTRWCTQWGNLDLEFRIQIPGHILSVTLTIEPENGGYDYRNVTCTDFISSTYEYPTFFLAINAPLHHLRHSLMPVKLFGAISADWTCHIQWHVWHT